MITALFISFLSLTSRGDGSGGWTRFVEEEYNRPGIPLVLAYFDETDHALSATCYYRYTEGRDPVVLHGKKESDGKFRPIVTCEVATEGKTKWKTIRADVEQSDSESITVGPNKPIALLSISMEPFRGGIGIYRYGRLVLETGDAAIFEMDDLLPTADSLDDTGDFKGFVFPSDDEEKQTGFGAGLVQPAELFSLTSLGGRLIGDFVFGARSGKAVNIEGTRTLDGDFWPNVTFHVANSDQVWKTIGESKHSGIPTTLQIPSGEVERIRVLLTDYKPLIGKYKYGKIVFSNGQSGVFSLDLLDPKK